MLLDELLLHKAGELLLPSSRANKTDIRNSGVEEAVAPLILYKLPFSLIDFLHSSELLDLFSISAACTAVSKLGVSTMSWQTVDRNVHGPFKASIKETASYPGGMCSQLP